MKTVKYLSIVSILTVTACAGGASNYSSYDQRKAEVSGLYSGIIHDSVKARIDPQKCNSQHYKNAKQKADLISSHVGSEYAASKSYKDTSIYGSVLDGLNVLIDYHVDGLFEIADTARSKGCKAVARDAYEDVIKLYVGNSYQGYRDRAKAGLDSL